MAILELREFTGTAEVLGQVREVAYMKKALYIECSYAEAHEILGALSAGKLKAADYAKQRFDINAQVATEDPDKFAREQVTKVMAAKNRNKALEEVRAAEAESPFHDVAPKQDIGLENALKGQQPPVEMDPDAKPPGWMDAKAADDPHAQAVADLQDAKRLGDVLAYLHSERGCKSVSALVGACRLIKERVPLLAKIEGDKLEERVARAAATMHLFDGGSNGANA